LCTKLKTVGNDPMALGNTTIHYNSPWNHVCRLRLVRSEPHFYSADSMPLLELTQVKKCFLAPGNTTHCVIDIPRFELPESGHVALAGESGSGKTTLLNLIAGIVSPDSGSIKLDGRELANLREGERDRARAQCIGYIFQTFNLLPGYTCLENVLLGMAFGPGVNRGVAETLLRRVGLDNRLHYYPRHLSTGQHQRVAVARALANRPQLVLADEPTGNLDRRNAAEALTLIRETCCENNAALLVVSHDREVLARFEKVVQLADINVALQKAPA
jgi:ABC-type lipoprotein export system ATPase subunit